MGGMLIDDHKAVGGLRNDIILVQLRTRCPQRQVSLGRGRRGLCHGCGRFEHARGGFGKAAHRTVGVRERHLVNPRAVGCDFGGCVAENAGGHGAGTAVPFGQQRMAQGRHDQPAHQGGIAKAHFGFGGVHIHVHQPRRAIHEKRHDGVTVTRQHIRIAAAQRAHQQLVAHRPAVDEQILRHRGAPRIGRQAGSPPQANVFARGVNPHGIVNEFAPQHRAKPHHHRVEQFALRGVGAKHLFQAAIRDVIQDKGGRGFGHRQPFDDLGDGHHLGAIRAHEFQPRGRGIEDVAQLDDRARRKRRGFDAGRLARRHREAGRSLGSGRT